jgi:MFS family permease
VALGAPAWVAYLLLGLAVVATVLGPRGQRPVNAAMLSAGAFVCAFFGLRGVGHPWLAPITAVIAAVLGALLGLIADAWGTAALLGGVFAAAAGAGIAALKGPWAPVAAVAGSIGLFLGITRQRRLEILLPPLFAAIFAALGATIGWAPHRRGAILWRLNDLHWVLGLTAALAIPLVVLAVQREKWRQRKLEGRTREMDDEDLKKALAARQPEYERAAQAAGSAAVDPAETAAADPPEGLPEPE